MVKELMAKKEEDPLKKPDKNQDKNVRRSNGITNF